MILATFRDYVDPDALWRILAVTLLASVLVPVAFAAAITGQGRREQAVARGGSDAMGDRDGRRRRLRVPGRDRPRHLGDAAEVGR